MLDRRRLRSETAWLVLRHLGPRWVWFRLGYAWRRRSRGLARRTPLADWQQVPDMPEAEGALAFVPRGDEERWRATLRDLDAADEAHRVAVLSEAEAILGGQFLLFSQHRLTLGFPPQWNCDPFTGECLPTSVHWSTLPDFGTGDIKGVWELSRLPWAFTLGRAYARTGDGRFAEGFWRLFESWLAANPPNHGPQWKCGQEASVRLLAATWARRVLASADATTAGRLARWRRFVYATGLRIAANLDYALSQRNNHGVSECVGLLTAAAVLPTAPAAPGWRERAQRALRQQAAEVVYPDGAFAQHSSVYQRVLLHVLAWYVALERASGRKPDELVLEAMRRAGGFLRGLIDPHTGAAPLCGGNDGAQVLPLAEGDFLDFRPAVQLVTSLCEEVAAFSQGPWDEAVGWLKQGRLGPWSNGRQEAVFSAPVGGWYVLRRGDGRAFLRAVTQFRHRPTQADLLHVDIWWCGQSVTRDAGSYSYNATGRFAGGLGATRLHNTVEVDGECQMLQIRRFLYVPWPRGVVSLDPTSLTLQATHDGYARRRVRHTRAVRAEGDASWIVNDELNSDPESHAYRLHWLIGDWPHEWTPERGQLMLDMPHGPYGVRWTSDPAPTRVTLVRADATSDRGWWSPSYLHVEPALSLEVMVHSTHGAAFRTVFGPVI